MSASAFTAPARRSTLTSHQRRSLGLRILASIAVIASIFAVFGLLVPKIKESRYVRIQSAEVEGIVMLSREEVLRQAGITASTNIWEIDKELLTKKIAELPYVEECTVHVNLEGREVRIYIKERPCLAVLFVNNHFYELDPTGFVLEEVDTSRALKKPLITWMGEAPAVEKGKRVEAAALKKALQVCQTFMRLPMAREVTLSEICAVSENHITMYLNELPFEIRWGRGEVDKQALRLETLWRVKGTSLPCTRYLDLRFDDDVACL